MPLPPYPRITCLLQDVTALAFHKGNSCLCSVCIAFCCFLSALYLASYRMNEWMNENGVLHIGQQPGSALNSFFDHGNFEGMKTLSGRRALRCGKHQFCAKITVST